MTQEKCLSFRFRCRGLLILILTDVASVAGIFRGVAPVLLLGVARKRRISRPRPLSPKVKRLNISAGKKKLFKEMQI